MKRKGISLTALTIGIVILFILLSTVSISITYSVNNAKKRTFAEEIYNIQKVVDEYIQNEGELPLTKSVLQVQVSDETQFAEETIENKKVTLEELDLVELGIKNTVYGNKENAKDIYAISEKTRRVYYVAGFKSGEKTYYTLTDDLLKMVERNQEFQISEKSIVFTPSSAGWSNEGVSLVATVPSSYQNPTIQIDNSNIVFDTTTQDGATVYNINQAKLAQEYTVTIKYTKDGQEGTSKYKAKLDTKSPEIKHNQKNNNDNNMITGLSATDDKSGIVYFKYAPGVIENDVKSYMINNGEDIKNGTIPFNRKRACTIYAEDKVGNYSVAYCDVWGNVSSVKPDGRIIVPAGFSPSIYDGEKTVEEGFVIYNTDSLDGIDKATAMTKYNQFVWIPVEDMNNFVRKDGYYNGALQNFVSGKMATEPYSYDSTITRVNDFTGEYAEYEKLKLSVQKYKGFYIGRYETGTSVERLEIMNGTSIDTLVQKDKYVYNYVFWGYTMTNATTASSQQGRGAVWLSRNMYPESTKLDVVSTLCYGVQWDATLNFMKDVQNPNVSGKTFIQDSTGMGWYANNSSAGNPNLKTGIDLGTNAYNKVKNVYDLAGNVFEWTMESYSNAYRTYRGGCYGNDPAQYPVSMRSAPLPNATAVGAGFRVTLYLR